MHSSFRQRVSVGGTGDPGTGAGDLTVLVRLEGDLLALFAPLGVREHQAHVNIPVGQQVLDGVAAGAPLHPHALPHRLVVAAAQDVVVAQGHGVGVAARDIVAQWLPLQGQLAGLDLRERQAFGGPHGLWNPGKERRQRQWGEKRKISQRENISVS